MDQIKAANAQTIGAILRKDASTICYLFWQVQIIATHWRTLTRSQKQEVRLNTARINQLIGEFLPELEARIV